MLRCNTPCGGSATIWSRCGCCGCGTGTGLPSARIVPSRYAKKAGGLSATNGLTETKAFGEAARPDTPGGWGAV